MLIGIIGAGTSGLVAAKTLIENKAITNTIYKLTETLESAQSVFKHTGGLHACGIFNDKGELIRIQLYKRGRYIGDESIPVEEK